MFYFFYVAITTCEKHLFIFKRIFLLFFLHVLFTFEECFTRQFHIPYAYLFSLPLCVQLVIFGSTSW